ncbi:MAG: hypothetical protein AAFV53_17760 [Myxococcota bacterium]
MFLSRLSSDEQRAFLQVAVRLLEVDGLSDDERTAFGGLCERVGVRDDWAPDATAPLGAFLGQISRPSARAAALLELLGLAWVDTQYGDDERVFIQQIAQRWDISTSRLALMESWVVRQIALAEEGEQLVGGA